MSDQTEDVQEVVEVGDLSEILDTVEVEREVKGPDPEIWGDPEERHQADVEAGKVTEDDQINRVLQEKLDAGEDPVVELDDGTKVKGPDPAIWGDLAPAEVSDEDEEPLDG